MSGYPDDDDGAVLNSMAAAGVDMSQPLAIDFAVDAPDEAAAEKVAQALRQAGYPTEIDYDEGEPDEEGNIDPEDEDFGPAWTVYVQVQMVPAHDEIVRIQAELDRLAQPAGGRIDGWGAMIG